MGGKKSSPAVAPPPTPIPDVRAKTSAQEAAMGDAKASFAAADEQKPGASTLGSTAAPAAANTRKRRERDPAGLVPAGGSLGSSAVLTG